MSFQPRQIRLSFSRVSRAHPQWPQINQRERKRTRVTPRSQYARKRIPNLAIVAKLDLPTIRGKNRDANFCIPRIRPITGRDPTPNFKDRAMRAITVNRSTRYQAKTVFSKSAIGAHSRRSTYQFLSWCSTNPTV